LSIFQSAIAILKPMNPPQDKKAKRLEKVIRWLLKKSYPGE
jgi:hypothetical protein